MRPWMLTLLDAATGTGGPAGSPSVVKTLLYAGDKVRLTFHSGDSTAQTLVYENSDPIPTTRLAAGVEFYETGLTVAELTCLEVAHIKGGVTTAKVPSTGVVSCA